ncbi:hypothetical protein CEUSTIGMA_g4561.t1 [Chlamydomonas eustigma]|uniref:Lysosomal Pro-X carboxypeptidase n=1 Tax=Chlamydomonas eustigma TaxID=1157962 RepID=A0A250X236_9CHLO|nr:hypothetical protein CEUSTIGMA_g4561.t1 [Chlamydomonas eustigma]|eukprot:GAX77115.1 hypothetical protein CEUSTIGMA_g4561.t1 [Chlamydomonas eustigma]
MFMSFYYIFVLSCCYNALFHVSAAAQGPLFASGHRLIRTSSWRGRGLNRKADGTKAESYYLGTLVESWYTQPIDHFQFGKNDRKNVFKQRYYTSSKYFAPGGPIFFYAGNEADVMLYVNATGLMWENAKEFEAMIVFAEHRYYGLSQPFGPESWKTNPSYLTVEQALADYAHLIYGLKSRKGLSDSPVIVFGGSYGGMLAAWLRMKYPLLFQGAIAASAPIGAFPGSRAFKPSRFWEVVTRDATPAAGAPEGCDTYVQTAFRVLFSLSHEAVDRAQLMGLLRLCEPLDTPQDVEVLGYWIQGAFDAYAMGNYPYPSSYISGDPSLPLPAWPMREACKRFMAQLPLDHPPHSQIPSHQTASQNNVKERQTSSAATAEALSSAFAAAAAAAEPEGGAIPMTSLLEGLREAVGLLYNVSGDKQCFSLTSSGPAAGNVVGPWDYQFCTELDAQEVPYYPANGVNDMFWDQGPFDLAGINTHCKEAWGVEPRVYHSFIQFGGVEAAAEASNIVFSNGMMDPWSAFSVTTNISSATITVVNIPNGAHHVDLMFSHKDDTTDIIDARGVELHAMRTWIQQHRNNKIMYTSQKAVDEGKPLLSLDVRSHDRSDDSEVLSAKDTAASRSDYSESR